MHRLFLLSLILNLSFSLFSQSRTNIKAYLDCKNFYNPEIGNFVEIHLQFLAHTLKYVAIESNLQSEVAILYTIKQADIVVKTDAYRLQSPLMRDSIIEDFYEVRRIALNPGKYTLEISLSDLNANNPPTTAIQDLEVKDLSNQIAISSIETAEMMFPVKDSLESIFTKSGYEIFPRISNYYPSQSKKIPVYFEVYKNQNDPSNITFGLKQSIVDTKTKTELEAYTRYTKIELSDVLPFIRLIDISKLKSGEYNLEFSIINKENNSIYSSSYFFERFNEDEYDAVLADKIVLDPKFQESITDDSLVFYVASLIPISKAAEIRNIMDLLKTKDKENYRKYIQSYWVNTSNGVNTYEAWLKYKKQVLIVQKLFKTNFTDGYETDRGRVYLQFGPPNNVITRENSPSDYPYEIWRYDKIQNFSNKRFIFYNPDLVNNNYRLLHSDMQGEVQNYRWQQQLAKRNSSNSDIDNPNDGNLKHFGGNSIDLYNQY
jgi:GWxTD domain-containing protein